MEWDMWNVKCEQYIFCHLSPQLTWDVLWAATVWAQNFVDFQMYQHNTIVPQNALHLIFGNKTAAVENWSHAPHDNWQWHSRRSPARCLCWVCMLINAQTYNLQFLPRNDTLMWCDDVLWQLTVQTRGWRLCNSEGGHRRQQALWNQDYWLAVKIRIIQFRQGWEPRNIYWCFCGHVFWYIMKCHKVNMSLSKCFRELRQRKAINNAHWLIIIWCHNCGKPISNSQAINGWAKRNFEN